MTRRPSLILTGVIAALVAASCATVLLSNAADWEPAALVGLLLVLCIGSDAMTVEVRNVRITGSFLAIVLAMWTVTIVSLRSAAALGLAAARSAARVAAGVSVAVAMVRPSFAAG